MGGKLPYALLGRRLRALMERERLTAVQVSERIGASRGYMSRMVSGENRPSTSRLREIARVLNADYGELAELAGYVEAPEGDQPTILGWSNLPEPDRSLILGLVNRLVGTDDDRTAAPPVSPSGRDRNRAELVAIYDALPPDDRVELLRVARAARESVQRRSRQDAEEPMPLRPQEGQEPA